MNEVRTVNVIEIVGGNPLLYAFIDNPEGVEKAKNLFYTLAKECGFSDKGIEWGINSGRLESDNYELYFVYSIMSN